MKKLLSIIMALAILATMSMPFSALADEPKSAQMKLSACLSGDYILPVVDSKVSADLDDKYDVGCTDSLDEPTVLDALIMANIEAFGEEDFALSPTTYLEVNSDGWMVTCFGMDASYCSYYLNGAATDVAPNVVVSNGDYLDFAAMYSDCYSYFSRRQITVAVGEKFTQALLFDGYDASWNFVAGQRASDVDITIDGNVVGKTDSDGKACLSIDQAGSYVLGAKSEGLMIPYCEITVVENIKDSVKSKRANAVNYVIGDYLNADILNARNAYYYQILLEAGADLSATNDKFVALVKDMLAKNEGKLVENGKEDIGFYGSVISVLDQLGENPECFNGYNLVLAMENVDETACANPYYYKTAIRVATPEKAKKIINAYISNYYTMGKGMNYWGYSTDNTAEFLTAISKYASDFSSYVADATKLIESTLTADGYYSAAAYGTQANADSTAKVLMAYSAIGDTAKADKAYELLMNSFNGSVDGVLTYGDKDNAYATMDGIMAYNYYIGDTSFNAYAHKVHAPVASVEGFVAPTCKVEGYYYSVTRCSVCDKLLSSNKVIVKKVSHRYAGGVVTTAPTSSKLGVMTYECLGCGAKRTETIAKLKKVSLSSVSAKSKGFKASWKKVSSVTGYQIQYATNSKFTKGKKTATVSSASAVSKSVTKLKAKKKYYVRIRTYKTIKGKKYYSSWSKAKTVTTKK